MVYDNSKTKHNNKVIYIFTARCTCCYAIVASCRPNHTNALWAVV